MSEFRSAAPLSRSVKLAGSELTCSCHACAFFHSDDEEQQVLGPFAKEGLAEGDRFVQIINDKHRENRVRRLKAEGIDVDAVTTTGQLDMRPWEEAYLRGGNGFSQDFNAVFNSRGAEGGPEQRLRDDASMGQHGMGLRRSSRVSIKSSNMKPG